MSRKIKSAKGETVDFDLLAIKQQMATAPAPTNVEARKEFIDTKLRRRRTNKSTTSVNVEKNIAVDDKNDKEDEIISKKKEYEESLEVKLDIERPTTKKIKK